MEQAGSVTTSSSVRILHCLKLCHVSDYDIACLFLVGVKRTELLLA
jgi:hypothetical protein